MLHLRMLSLFLFLLTFSDQVLNSVNLLFKEEIAAFEACTMIMKNYIYGDSKTPFTCFLKTLVEKRISHLKKYSWLAWLYLSIYFVYIGLTFYEATDLEDFWEKLKSHPKDLELLLSGDKTLQKVRQKQLRMTEEGNKKRPFEKVLRTIVCWCCLESDTSLLRCGGCLKARYCGQKCQEEDWYRHGTWCRKRGWRWKEKKMEKRRRNKKNADITEASCEVD